METKRDIVDDKGIPVKLYLSKVRGGRVRIVASIPLGGSWLTYETLIRDVLEGRRAEIWLEFVKDTEEFKTKKGR